MSEFQPILTEHIKDKNCHSLSFYQNTGGYNYYHLYALLVLVEIHSFKRFQ